MRLRRCGRPGRVLVLAALATAGPAAAQEGSLAGPPPGRAADGAAGQLDAAAGEPDAQPDATADAAEPPPPDGAPLFETVVRAPRAAEESAGIRMTAEEVRDAPGLGADPLRVIDALPGVVSIATGLPYWVIRGAPPGTVEFEVDGVPVPAMFHAAFGPSVLPAPLLQSIEFDPDGGPISSGRHIGALIEATTAEPRTDRLGAWWDLRAIEASAGLEWPLSRDVTWEVSGRGSWAGEVVKYLSPDVDLAYGDYQTRLAWRISPHDRLTLLAFGSIDDVNRMPQNLLSEPLAYDFHRVVVRWDGLPEDVLALHATGWFGFDESTLGETRVSNWSGGGRAELVWTAGRGLRLRGGLDAAGRAFPAPTADLDSFGSLYPFRLVVRSRRVFVGGAWAEASWEPDDATRLVVGVRGDVQTVAGDATGWWDVRAELRRALAPWLAVRASLGTFHQPQTFFIELPGFADFALASGPQQAFRAAQGVEVELPWDLALSVEGFYATYENLAEYAGTQWPNSEADIADPANLFPGLSGRAFGLEVLLRRRLADGLFGWIAYTLSRSARDFPDDGWAPANTDRTHVLDAVVSWEFGWGWRVGARAHFHTGFPYTVQHGLPWDPDPLGPRNGARLPPMFRLDLRVDKTFRFPSWWFTVFAEFLNVTFARDSVGMSYDWGECIDGCPTVDQPPAIVVPTVGFSGAY